jgi:hypothetical protein
MLVWDIYTRSLSKSQKNLELVFFYELGMGVPSPSACILSKSVLLFSNPPILSSNGKHETRLSSFKQASGHRPLTCWFGSHTTQQLVFLDSCSYNINKELLTHFLAVPPGDRARSHYQHIPGSISNSTLVWCWNVGSWVVFPDLKAGAIHPSLCMFAVMKMLAMQSPEQSSYNANTSYRSIDTGRLLSYIPWRMFCVQSFGGV